MKTLYSGLNFLGKGHTPRINKPVSPLNLSVTCNCQVPLEFIVPAFILTVAGKTSGESLSEFLNLANAPVGEIISISRSPR